MPSRSEFKAAAFRGARGETGAVIDKSPYLETASSQTCNYLLSLPDHATLQKVQASWKDYRKGARVLFVMDVSRSMNDRLGSASASKLELAKQAVTSALGEFAPDDHVGLWSLAGTARQSLVDVRAIRDQNAQLRTEIDRLTPEGSGRSLYTTVADAVALMRQGFDRERINAVILLTDGRNDDPSNSDLNGLVRTLRAQPVDERVRVFTIVYGQGADRDALDKIALAARGVRYDAVDTSVIGRAVLDAVSNF